ncbi:MAG: hypothetical protein PVI07_08590 [Anaerolineae bacterium]
MKGLKQLTAAQKWTALLSILTSLLGLANLGRAGMALLYSARLPRLPTTMSLNYLAAVGAFWGVIFIVCTVSLSCFLSWGRWLTLAAVTFYQAHVWANHLLFDASHYARQTYARDLVLTLVFLLLFWGSLNHPRIRKTFRGDSESHISRLRPD